MSRRIRRPVTVLIAVLATVVLPMPSARAAAPVGATWFTDGTQAESGAPVTELRVYATGAFVDFAYTLVLGDAGGDPGHVSHACFRTVQVLNPTVRFANAQGFIPTTVGRVTHTVPGTYQVCFKDNVGHNTGTPGATFTIL